jgi:hypothetical protein
MNKIINNPIEISGISKSELSNLSSLEELESLVAASIREKIQLWIENSELNPPQPTTRCRECGNVANFSSKRVGYIRTQFGLIRYLRAEYLCPDCRGATCPLDERLNPVESLARLRTKISAGKNLPVGELAQAWGLGTLEIFPPQSPTSAEKFRSNSQVNVPGVTGNVHHQLSPLLCQSI